MSRLPMTSAFLLLRDQFLFDEDLSPKDPEPMFKIGMTELAIHDLEDSLELVLELCSVDEGAEDHQIDSLRVPLYGLIDETRKEHKPVFQLLLWLDIKPVIFVLF